MSKSHLRKSKLMPLKVETLVKSLEVESRKIKRETAAREKNLAANMLDCNKDLRKTKRSALVFYHFLTVLNHFISCFSTK